ncbi:MAG: agmatinase [Candidatus Bathyarchaeota archaeon]|jgi:agmatinase|nr:agmatinase [Candidatus Bathyarchaeota archaeon A05DMB-5]MDH7557045.1 agmatinase [Candidatus Bathyarchaeota archaeon]
MSHHEFFVSQSNVFSGFQKPFEKAKYVIFGVPFDVTSTYRTGARFGPNAVREASLNIETYSFRTDVDVEDLQLHDLGDLHVLADTEKTLKRIRLVVADILEAGKIPVTIGGEHTITLGVAKGLGKRASKTAIVSFDAHLDLRSEFMGLTLSHTTFMRRINEKVKPAKIVEVGTRAVCKEELAYAKKSGIEFFTAQQIRKDGVKRVIKQLHEKLAGCESIYLSVDMDVLDPAFAPAVQNPEPEGLEPHVLLDILCDLCDKRVVGFDVLEVAPNYDQGVSAVQAAKVIFEALCCLEKSSKSGRK